MQMEQVVSSELQSSEKATKFRALAEYRVGRLVRLIAQLGNLSRRSTYWYTSVETDQMFKALRGALDAAEAKFREQQATTFRFD
jgi:hypothetical protein